MPPSPSISDGEQPCEGHGADIPVVERLAETRRTDATLEQVVQELRRSHELGPVHAWIDLDAVHSSSHQLANDPLIGLTLQSERVAVEVCRANDDLDPKPAVFIDYAYHLTFEVGRVLIDDHMSRRVESDPSPKGCQRA